MPPRDRDELPIDTAFDLLSNERRRHVLCLLVERDEALELETVAREVLARIEGTDPEAVDDDAFRSVYVSLYQNHIPKLAEAGVIRYDSDEQITRIRHTPETWKLLQCVGVERRTPWYRECLLVFAVSVLFAGLSVGGLLPASQIWVPPVLALVGGFALLSVYQYHTRYRISVSNRGDLTRDEPEYRAE